MKNWGVVVQLAWLTCLVVGVESNLAASSSGKIGPLPLMSRSSRIGRSVGTNSAFMLDNHNGLSLDSHPSSSACSDATWNAVSSLRGGVSAEVSDIVVSAYDWCINLGAPSALVAGAVIATIYENIGSGALDVRTRDAPVSRFLKRLTRVLLISAFSLEVLAIFVTTVTGTMLLSRTLDYMDEIVPVTLETTPLAFLRSNFGFEYLTARIAFLQGLVNWITAIALAHIIPNSQTGLTRKMNKFIGTFLLTTVLLMLAFYNNHMTFYDNYWGMLTHWFQVTLKRFVFHNPPRPLMYLITPAMLACLYFAIQTFFYNTPDDLELLESMTAEELEAIGYER